MRFELDQHLRGKYDHYLAKAMYDLSVEIAARSSLTARAASERLTELLNKIAEEDKENQSWTEHSTT